MGWLVFAAVFCTYAWTAGAAVGWLDTPEIAAASASLGITHSPGHPLPALLGRLLGLLPLGDLHTRASLASALAGAGAASAVFVAGRELLALAAPRLEARDRAALAAAAALAFALCGAAWIPATRAEVYALQTLLCAGALAGALHWQRTAAARGLLAASLCAGLALANHPLIALAALAPVAVAILAGKPAVKVALAGILLVLLGGASLLYLPVRASAHPELDWGAPETADRFAWTISGRAFHKSVGSAAADGGQDGAEIAATLAVDAGPILLPLALLGLYLGLRRPGWRRALLALAGVVAGTAAGRALVGFDPGVPDDRAYLAPAALALVLLGAAGAGVLAAAIAEARPGHGRTASLAVTAALALAVALQPLLHLADASQRTADLSDRVAAWEIERLPPRAILLPSHFQTSFRLAALRAIEGARPDVALLDLGFLTYPGAPGEARRRHPELAGLIDAPLRLGAPLPVDRLRATGRPVLVQLQPDLDAAALAELLPAGPYAHLPPASPTAEQRLAAERADVAARAALGDRLADPRPADRLGAGDALLWYDVNRLRFYCTVVRPTAWRPPPDGVLGSDCAMAIPP